MNPLFLIGGYTLLCLLLCFLYFSGILHRIGIIDGLDKVRLCVNRYNEWHHVCDHFDNMTFCWKPILYMSLVSKLDQKYNLSYVFFLHKIWLFVLIYVLVNRAKMSAAVWTFCITKVSSLLFVSCLKLSNMWYSLLMHSGCRCCQI